jgi:hypothetical protein
LLHRLCPLPKALQHGVDVESGHGPILTLLGVSRHGRS